MLFRIHTYLDNQTKTMNNIFTKRTVISLTLAAIALIGGLVLRNETFVFNIYDTYYVASYLTIGIFIIYLIVLINLIYFVRVAFKRYKTGKR